MSNILKIAFDSFRADGHPMCVHSLARGAIAGTDTPDINAHRIAYRLPDAGNGLVFIDVDTKHGANGHKALEDFDLGEPFQKTNIYNGKQACHYVFRFEGEPGTIHPFGRAAGVEFFTKGRSIYLSPSRCKEASDHPDEYYNGGDWKELSEAITNAKPMPAKLAARWHESRRKPEVERVKTSRPLSFGCNIYATKALETMLETIRSAPDGAKDNTANACTYRMGVLIGHGVLDRIPAIEAMRSACLESGYDAAKTEDKLSRCVEDGIKDSPSEIWEHNACVQSEDEEAAKSNCMPLKATKTAFVEAFMLTQGGGLCSISRNNWRAWDGKRYTKATAYEVELRLRLYFAKVREEVMGSMLNKTEAKKVLRMAEETPYSNVFSSFLAETAVKCQVGADAFDAHPELLNFTNGTYNLSTGELRPHAMADKLTKMARVAFTGEGSTKQWDGLLDFLCGGDEVKVKWLKSMLADALYGDNRQQKILIVHGKGANGKSVLIKVLQKVLGDYMAVLPSRELGENKMGESATSPALVAAHRSRLATVVELKQNFVFNEGTIKNLTSQDGLASRGLYENTQTNVQLGMMVIACNELPKSDEGGFAMRRRLAIINAPNAVDDANRVVDLDACIVQDEGAAVLSQLAVLCTAQRRTIAKEPAEVGHAAEEYSSSAEYKSIAETYFEFTGSDSDRLDVAFVHGALVIDAYVNDRDPPKGFEKTRFRKFVLRECGALRQVTMHGVDMLTGVKLTKQYEVRQFSAVPGFAHRQVGKKILN